MMLAVTGPVVLRIESCANCPHVGERGHNELVCLHDELSRGGIWIQPEPLWSDYAVGDGCPPEWCPLREEKV